MKKKILTLALLAMSLVSFSGMAQNTTSNTSCTQTEKCCKAGKDMKGKKEGMKEKKNPYEGLTLTDAQKSKLQQLDEKRMAARRQKMEAMRANKDAQKGQKPDMEAMKAQRKAEKIEYLQEVKEIIGPDQYVVFLENFYVNGGQGGKKMVQGPRGQKPGFAHNKDGKKKGMKDRKQGQRGNGQRGAQGQQSQAAQS